MTIEPHPNDPEVAAYAAVEINGVVHALVNTYDGGMDVMKPECGLDAGPFDEWARRDEYEGGRLCEECWPASVLP